MDATREITVEGVLREGIGIGIKNAPSLIVAAILWLITIWIPYLNVGTTIAMATIPIELSKGKIITPTFIFDSKYRQYMGEYFTLVGLMLMAIIPAFMFMVIPGYVIGIAWSLAVYIMLDKGIAPGEALIRSNKATYGYKWTIFLVYLVIALAIWLIMFVLTLPAALISKLSVGLGAFLFFIVYIVVIVISLTASLGCSAVIYRNLTSDVLPPAEEYLPPYQAPVV